MSDSVKSYTAAIEKQIRMLIEDIDTRRDRFDYLMEKREDYLGINNEQAEAYDDRLKHHEDILIEETGRLMSLRSLLLRMK